MSNPRRRTAAGPNARPATGPAATARTLLPEMAATSAAPLPDHVVAMVRRTAPGGGCVVPGSTPVVAFGDPATAEVATLGINPSWAEFTDAGGGLLTGDQRRLATTDSLGVSDLAQATDAQVRQVVEDCAGYFGRRPYWRWFGTLDRVLGPGCDASYLDRTACHLDLVQWATAPIWSKLPKEVRARLLADGLPHLRAQLEQDNIHLLLLNGRQVIDRATGVGLARLQQVGSLPYPGGSTKLYAGTAAGVRVLGWSANIQSTPGANANAFLAELGGWVRDHWAPTQSRSPVAAGDGAVLRGLRVRGVAELRRRLREWLDGTDEATLGDVGSFGGSPWLHVDLAGHAVVLNADTKRAAIAEFLDHPRPALHVVANRRGMLNKVVFRPDGTPTPGWYAYTTQPLPAPTAL